MFVHRYCTTTAQVDTKAKGHKVLQDDIFIPRNQKVI